MSAGGRIVEDMSRLVALFSPLCADRTTMDELAQMISTEERWIRAHDLFDRPDRQHGRHS